LAQLAFSYYQYSNHFKYVDKFLALTPFQMEKVKSLGISDDKLELKPNFVDANNLRAFDDIVRNGYIYVGRLEESKGIYRLLEAWQKLESQYELTIVGVGNIDDLQEKFKLDNVTFLGKLPREKTLSLIRSARFLIQPSIWYETFGLTILEAMSQGVPVIGFDVGTRKDFIVDSYNGFVAEPESLHETVRRSHSFANYQSLCDNAIRTASGYHEKLITQKLVDIYEKLLKS
jgi:glycosyltransferase involved in cell wall biosynthesis